MPLYSGSYSDHFFVDKNLNIKSVRVNHLLWLVSCHGCDLKSVSAGQIKTCYFLVLSKSQIKILFKLHLSIGITVQTSCWLGNECANQRLCRKCVLSNIGHVGRKKFKNIWFVFCLLFLASPTCASWGELSSGSTLSPVPSFVPCGCGEVFPRLQGSMSGPFSPSSWMSVARLTDIFLRDGGREGGSWGGGWVTNPRAADRKEKVKKASKISHNDGS